MGFCILMYFLFLFKGPSQSPSSILEELSPRPRIKNKRPRKRACESSAVLTSSPYKKMLEDKIAAQNKGTQKKVKRKSAAEVKKKDDTECLYCGELFSVSGGDWIRCEGCQKWAHVDCSNEIRGEFICEICMDEQ